MVNRRALSVRLPTSFVRECMPELLADMAHDIENLTEKKARAAAYELANETEAISFKSASPS